MQITKIFPPSKLGIVNVRYKMEDMEFDAVIDFEHELHAYELSCFKDKIYYVPIELYNCSENWGIWMIYPKFSRQQMHEFIAAGITGTPLETLIESETQQWIETDPEDISYCPPEPDYDPEFYEDEIDHDEVPEDVDPTPLPGEPEYEYKEDRDPRDDFYEYLDRYGSGAFTVAIVEMLQSGELPVTWEQAQALWERGGKTS